MTNEPFDRAKKNKADEFYTQMPDIEAEMRHYKEQFRDKVILCGLCKVFSVRSRSSASFEEKNNIRYYH